jgi:hypothetical protein
MSEVSRGAAGTPAVTVWPSAAASVALLDHLTGAVLRQPATALPLPPATDRTIWSADRLDSPTLAAIRQRAAAERGTPWPQPLAHAAARYHGDGNRTEYEAAVFARQERLTAAVILATVDRPEATASASQSTGAPIGPATADGPKTPDWLDEVADGLILLCEQSSWCWPAHDDTSARHGAVLPTVTDPYLDLGAAEVVAQLAWTDHVLGADLDQRYPGLRDRLRYEANVRVFTPFSERRDWHWLGLTGPVHNWNPWIHGQVLAAALRLVDDPDRRFELVRLCVTGLDRYLAALPPDGAIDEGYSYWWNGAGRALEALDLLHHATAGAVDGFTLPAVRETIAFPHRMALGGGWYVNYADGSARPTRETPWHVLFTAARRVGDPLAEAHARAQRRPGQPLALVADGLPRLLRALADPAWAAAPPATEPLPRDVWLPSTAVFVARPTTGSAHGLTVSAKGGHNGENHNHLDVGTVIVASDGVPVLVDPGRPTYTAQTFGPDRYTIWTMRSDWHCVPEIDGQGQGLGPEYAATAAGLMTTATASQFEVELRGAYAAPQLVTWRRTIRLDRPDPDGTVTISDEWTLDPTSYGDGPFATLPQRHTGTPSPNVTQGRSLCDIPVDPSIPDTVQTKRPSDVRQDPSGADPRSVASVGNVRLHWILAGTVVDHGPDWADLAPVGGARAVRLAWTPGVRAQFERRDLDDRHLTAVWGDHLTRLTLTPAVVPNPPSPSPLPAHGTTAWPTAATGPCPPSPGPPAAPWTGAVTLRVHLLSPAVLPTGDDHGPDR